MKKTNNSSLNSPPVTSPKPHKNTQPGEAGGNGQVFSKQKPQAMAAAVSNQVVAAKQAMESMVSVVDDGPCHAHVYWHVNPQHLKAVRQSENLTESQGTLLLRLHDKLCATMTGFSPGPLLELEVARLNGYRHVEIPDSGETLVAELALREAAGRLVTLACSEPLPCPDQVDNHERLERVDIGGPVNQARVEKLYSVPPGEAKDTGQTFPAQELRAINAQISDRLPAEQAIESMVSLIDIDPCHAHIYWHVNAVDLEKVCRAAGCTATGENVVLRLQDALCTTMSGFIPWPPIELELAQLSGNQDVEIPDPGKTLVAELALRGLDGTLHTLATSGPVRLPQLGQAGIQGSVELVVIEEPGMPPRVVEKFPTPSNEIPCLSPGTFQGSSSTPQGAPSSYASVQGYAGGEHA